MGTTGTWGDQDSQLPNKGLSPVSPGWEHLGSARQDRSAGGQGGGGITAALAGLLPPHWGWSQVVPRILLGVAYDRSQVLGIGPVDAEKKYLFDVNPEKEFIC